jgi:hypothetical protein
MNCRKPETYSLYILTTIELSINIKPMGALAAIFAPVKKASGLFP